MISAGTRMLAERGEVRGAEGAHGNETGKPIGIVETETVAVIGIE